MSNKWLTNKQQVIWLDAANNIIVEDGHYKHITTAEGKTFVKKEFKPGHWQAHEITEEGEIKQALQSTKVGMYV